MISHRLFAGLLLVTLRPQNTMSESSDNAFYEKFSFGKCITQPVLIR